MFYYFNAEMKYWEKPAPIIKPWATATDAELAEMLQAHYDGLIDLHTEEGWEIGSERTVHLNDMAASEVGETHVAQDVTMVLMNKGGKLLSDGVTECAFIVGQKNCLASGTSIERGYMNSSDTNSGGWNNCARRRWCNDVYKNALPSTLVGIFKEHLNVTANGSSSGTATSNDYFALPAEKEIFGSNTYANSTAESSLIQLEYYKTSSNRIKKVGETGYAYYWWNRSPFSGNSNYFCYVSQAGGPDYGGASSTIGIAPHGCI